MKLIVNELSNDEQYSAYLAQFTMQVSFNNSFLSNLAIDEYLNE